ncbi:MAG: NTP transferase domain-containing protein [Spirochaetaceae bacterium]|jgi:CTP:phosphocholine cytidylyltransferase-like protein|nr:NTP transferase domain-containing protein [Spirochaetaceae bacterium]
MELTQTQFDILAFLEGQQGGPELTQRALAKGAGLAVGTVNKAVLKLTEDGLINKNAVTAKGLEALEPYRVQRAIFLAAGFGSRLVPITLNTPKPLVRVKGVRIIDTLLDAVSAVGITEIIIVRGYLGEQFDQLLYKYPNVKFLENPLYNEANNISSAMLARYQLQNAYLLESDLLLRNPKLISKYQYTTNYLGVPTDRTDDWCFETKGGIITKLRVGGKNCHHMFGISYWNKRDGAKMAGHIQEVYEMPGGKERYWDQVALDYFIKDYEITVRECSFDDITEIDTFSELKKLDETYRV